MEFLKLIPGAVFGLFLAAAAARRFGLVYRFTEQVLEGLVHLGLRRWLQLKEESEKSASKILEPILQP
jgi:hypothetical protein